MKGQSHFIMKKDTGKAISLLLIALLLFSAVILPRPAYAAVGNYIKISQNGGFFAAPGDKEHPIEVTVKNNDDKEEHKVTVKLNGRQGEFTVKTKPMNVTLAPGEETKLTFSVDIARTMRTSTYTLVVTAEENGEVVGNSNMRVSLTTSNGTYEGLGINYALDNAEGLVAGTVNDLKFEFYNRGSVRLRDVSAEISLPDGITVNNAAATANLGYLDIGERKNASFPLKVEESIENTNHPIKLSITAKVLKDGVWEDRTFSDTFYISAIGGNGGTVTKNLTIGNVTMPQSVKPEEDFTLSFTVTNNGSTEVEHLKIEAVIPDGLLNKTTATFVENSLAAGQSKTYSVTLMATDESKDTTYPIKLSVSSLKDEASSPIMQYSSIYVKSDGNSSVKTPRLMVDTYDYGGGYVKTGDEFALTVGLMNTAGKELSNIKVTVNGGDTFVPVGSSNAFFVDSIGSKGHYSKMLHLRANAGAEQTTATLTVNMDYEDASGNAYTAEDTISIPLVQDTRLEVNDVAAPWECYVGSQGSTSVEFYNMGKTTLNNLRVTAEGNFDTMDSNSYYVGNMSSGSTDDFSFSFIPREVGPMEGKVIFTYEDPSGQEQRLEKEFVFEAMEMPVWDDPGMDMPVEEPQNTVSWKVVAGIGAAVAVVGFVLFRRHRKKKMNQQLEMEDE